MTTILRAARIRTVDPTDSVAEAVAIDGGAIVGVGGAAELATAHPEATVDDRFADAVIVPGFVEAHCHVMEGAMWAFPYLGSFDRVDPDGTLAPGVTSLDGLVERLAALDSELTASGAEPHAPLVAWGFDPIHLDPGQFPSGRLDRSDLDRACPTRPVFVFHASGHLATVNTAMLDHEGITAASAADGVPAGADGRPNGELQEPVAMARAMTGFRPIIDAMSDPASIRRLARSARRAGCTTVTELGATRLDRDDVLDRWLTTAVGDDLGVRMVVLHNPSAERRPIEASVDHLLALRERSTPSLRMGMVKIILDGSIQGYTARLNPPGYLGDRPNGLWLVTPERFREVFTALHAARIDVHVHCNGDQAVDLFLDTLEPIQAADPWSDHRHTVQHCQLTTRAQYERMAAVGAGANLFTNHLFYWGDQHRDLTVGPERAALMDNGRLADECGVRYSIHSDASVTPLGHLHTMWCAVNRVSATGDVLGPEWRIDAARALRAATIDAAHQLRLDDELGSIEVGKRADLTVLSDDPVAVDPMTIRDLEVRTTVVDGIVDPAAGR